MNNNEHSCSGNAADSSTGGGLSLFFCHHTCWYAERLRQISGTHVQECCAISAQAGVSSNVTSHCGCTCACCPLARHNKGFCLQSLATCPVFNNLQVGESFSFAALLPKAIQNRKGSTSCCSPMRHSKLGVPWTGRAAHFCCVVCCFDHRSQNHEPLVQHFWFSPRIARILHPFAEA